MPDENNIPMNLDLNLGPVDDTRFNNELILGSLRQRNRRWRSFWRQIPIPLEAQNPAMELIAGNELQTGDEGHSKDETLDKKKDCQRDSLEAGNYFDCNICLDLAKEPVVTCCGHLFCWPCLYRWLHHPSGTEECPVCKGQVSTKKVTPIYGRGVDTRDPGLETMKIPLRPQAQRVESWRQAIQRTALTSPMEEMIRQLGTTFDLSHELNQRAPLNPLVPRGSPERTNSRLNWSRTSLGMNRDTSPILMPDNLNYLNEISPLDIEPRDDNNHRAYPSVSIYSSGTYLSDDRDSVSSIAAVIHSESPTIDTALEIDSTVARSTLSSRRRNDASRLSDVDSGDSRANRRRRLQ